MKISDRFGRKIALVPNLTAFFGSLLIAGSSLDIWMLILSRALMGVFCSGFFSSFLLLFIFNICGINIYYYEEKIKILFIKLLLILI